MAEWTLLTNHGHALLCVARDQEMTLRQIGDCIGITERAAHRIVSDLVEEGYLKKSRVGTRNTYEIRPDVPMRHPLVADHWVGELLAVLVGERRPAGTAGAR